jgi:hypothetical protein
MRTYLLVYNYLGWTKECKIYANSINEAIGKFLCPKNARIKSVTEID